MFREFDDGAMGSRETVRLWSMCSDLWLMPFVIIVVFSLASSFLVGPFLLWLTELFCFIYILPAALLDIIF